MFADLPDPQSDIGAARRQLHRKRPTCVNAFVWYSEPPRLQRESLVHSVKQ